MAWERIFTLALTLACAVAYPSQLADHDVVSMLQTGVMTEGPSAGLGALNVSALTIDAGPARESAIRMGDADAAFTVRMSSDGVFKLDHRGLPGLIVGADGDVTVMGKILASGDVQVGSDNGGAFTFKGLSQWLLHIDDSNFDDGGWTNQSVTTCGGSPVPILGGYGKFAGGSVQRNYRNLPPHQEIRLKANFHFIDNWSGEMAYLKLDHQAAWTDLYDAQGVNSNGINLCGSPTHEAKFAVPIDVAIQHTSAALSVTFGAKMTKHATEASWGVSGLQIYVR